jgi:predicted metal-dependent hydrolase
VRTPSAALLEAQRLLADGLPFHAHEVLEDAWKAAPPAERELWRGLAQLAVAATHAARGNRAGALALLRRGAAAVSTYRAAGIHELDIDTILGWVESAIAMVDASVPVRLPPPPLVPQQR